MLLIKKYIYVLLTICMLSAKLGIKDIQPALSKLEKGDADTIKKSIYNPVYGILLEYSSTLTNLRFFGPQLATELEDDQRSFFCDNSSNPLTNLAIKLFPSPSGNLSVVGSSNCFSEIFKKALKQNKAVLDIMAQISVEILKSPSEVNPNFSLFEETYESTFFSLTSDEFIAFKELRRIALSPDTDSFLGLEASRQMSIMLIQSFLLHSIDNIEDL